VWCNWSNMPCHFDHVGSHAPAFYWRFRRSSENSKQVNASCSESKYRSAKRGFVGSFLFGRGRWYQRFTACVGTTSDIPLRLPRNGRRVVPRYSQPWVPFPYMQPAQAIAAFDDRLAEAIATLDLGQLLELDTMLEAIEDRVDAATSSAQRMNARKWPARWEPQTECFRRNSSTSAGSNRPTWGGRRWRLEPANDGLARSLAARLGAVCARIRRGLGLAAWASELRRCRLLLLERLATTRRRLVLAEWRRERSARHVRTIERSEHRMSESRYVLMRQEPRGPAVFAGSGDGGRASACLLELLYSEQSQNQ